MDGDNLEFGTTGGVDTGVFLIYGVRRGCKDISGEGVRDTEEVCVVVVIAAEFEFQSSRVGSV